MIATGTTADAVDDGDCRPTAGPGRAEAVPDAGHELVAVYAAEHDRLVRAATLVTGSAACGEDIVQDAFAKLQPRLARIDNPAAWLRTVVINASRNEIRNRLVRRRVLESNRSSTTAVDAPANELIASLRRLPARQRAVIVLRFYEDRSEAEIAEILGIRPGTVKSSLHRALTTLRHELPRGDEP